VPTVKVGDINIYCETHGQGEPLILINGTRFFKYRVYLLFF